MAVPVIMPRQGQSVETCIFSEWFKKVGENVKKGEILFSFETDKASFEQEAEEDGVLLAVFCEEGDEIPVLNNIGAIGQAGENIDALVPGGASATPEEKPTEAVQPAAITVANEVVAVETSPASEDAKISPRAKKLAAKSGVDYKILIGTGPYGRIIERDVEAYMASKPKMTPLAKEVAKQEKLPAVESGSGLGGAVKASDLQATANPVYSGDDFEIKKLTHIRKLIAKAMHKSLQNSAQLTHHLGADARQMLAMRKKVKKAAAERGAANLTLNDMICFAVVKALKKFPNANAHFMGDSVKYFNKVHLGLAVDTDRGLMVPTIKNADDLSITGLASQMKELAEQCRAGSINPELLSSEGASFTVSNLGNYGVEMFTPVINLPQVAILGVNTIIPRPKDLGDGVYGFVPYLGLSLTYDHQALDGGEATRFVKQIATEIENLNFEF